MIARNTRHCKRKEAEATVEARIAPARQAWYDGYTRNWEGMSLWDKADLEGYDSAEDDCELDDRSEYWFEGIKW